MENLDNGLVGKVNVSNGDSVGGTFAVLQSEGNEVLLNPRRNDWSNKANVRDAVCNSYKSELY